MDYEIIERYHRQDGVRYEIIGIVDGNNNIIRQWLKDNMKVGDTVVWVYPESSTKRYSYEDMLIEWQKWDDYENGI